MLDLATVTAVIGIGSPIALGIWHVIQYRNGRTDKQAERRETQEDKHLALMNREREQLAASNETVVRNLRQEVDRRTDALHECEADRHVGWELARFWHGRAWEMMGRAGNARQIAESVHMLAQTRGLDLPPPTWSDGPLTLPPFDAFRPARFVPEPPPKQ